jgi:hypothetical protein
MATATEPIAWEEAPQQARQRAAREGKPVLLDFSAAPD